MDESQRAEEDSGSLSQVPNDQISEKETGLAAAPVDPNESPVKVIWTLAWPAVALNSMQTVNNLLDRGFIGHLSQASLTAHGASINILFLLFSLAMSLSTASTALVSRAYGAGNGIEVRMAVRKCLTLTFIAAVVFGTLGILSADFAANQFLPKEDLEAKKLMVRFLLVFASSLPAMYSIQTLAGALRGIGDTKSPMVISGCQIALHILLNLTLIGPPKHIAGNMYFPGANLGLVGAGLALSASAWIAAIAYMAYSGRTPLGSCWKLVAPDRQWTQRILKIAIPAALMAFLRVGSLMVFTLILKHVSNGSIAIAAMSVGFAVEGIMFMPAFGLSMSAAALVGQSLGMKLPDRAERLGWCAARQSVYVTLALSLPIFIFAPQIAYVMVGDKVAMIAEASMLLRILIVTETLFCVAMVLLGAMQGAGDTIRPMWITVFAMWGLRVPLSFLLAIPFGMGSTGAWIAMSFTQAVQGVMTMVAWKKGRWKTTKV